jgi:hypothetical protein
MQITEVVLKFCQGLALGQVVRELLKVAEPHLTILPMDVSCAAHHTIVAPGWAAHLKKLL